MTQTKYFLIEKLFLQLAGNSLDVEKGVVYKVYSIILLTLCTTYPFLAMADLLTQKFNDVVNGWFYTFAIMCDTSIVIFGYINRRQLGKLLRRFEHPPFSVSKERGNEKEERKLLNAWIWFYKKQAVFLLCGALFIITYRCIYSLIRRYIYAEWILPWSPVATINTSSSPIYEIIWFCQNTVCVYYGFTTIPLVVITAGSLSFMTVQFQILHRYLERILKEKSMSRLNLNKDDDIHWQRLNSRIKCAVTYHLEITNATREIDCLFNSAYLGVFLLSLLLICIDTYQASMLPHFNLKLIYLLMEVLIVFSPAVVYCYYGERITHESQKIGEIAYKIDFVGTDLRFQKSIIMIIRQSQKPLIIKAGNMINGSFAVVVWILRTSFSAYMMLRTMNTPK